MTHFATTMASITCHRHLSTAGYDHYGSQAGDNHNTSPSLHLAASTLAATPLYPNPAHDPSTSLAVPSLDIPAATAVDKSHHCHSFDLTGGVYIVSATDSVSPMDAATYGMVDTPKSSPPKPPSSDGLRTPKRKRTASPPTKAPGHIRASSRSTHSRGHSRQSSPFSHRRTNTTTSLTPSVPDTTMRHENLLALHRESCRLFQDPNVSKSPSPPQTPHTRPIRTFSDLSSPPVTPILEQQHSTLYQTPSDASNQTVPVQHVEVEVTTNEQTKPTIIEWTSPSTRRREYEAIDRASSGVRGFWRRVAPRWCQFGDSRLPFFEEGKDGKANYEGSVRRFRMDLPDEPEQCQSRRRLKFKRNFVVRRSTGLL
ncbi:hypothetical protein BJY04DRAFT_203547 [Aspergillus karnatakaensis]|uniref:uncharacterized protein n=1 Tax=Aspergillus karnatakaensis TaxID=1810916 RepID=UPI003CCCC69D